MDKQLVVKSNFLIEASFRLSAIEQKIILTLATKLKNSDQEFQKYFFNLGELASFLGLASNADYTYLRDVTKTLLGKVLTLVRSDSILQTHWLESVEYFDSKGTAAIRFNPDLKPFLIQLKNNFTKYQLRFAIQLKSRFSIRLYELMKQYEKVGYREFTLVELREKLGILKNEYPFYGNFKAKVLSVAKRELNEKTDISFDFEEIKIGRCVGKIRFVIRPQEPTRKAIQPELPTQGVIPDLSSESQTMATLEKLELLLPPPYRGKESIRKLLVQYLEDHGFDYVARNIEYANTGSNAINPGASLGKGSNYRSYLAKALRGDYGLASQEDRETAQAGAEKARQEKEAAEAAARQTKEATEREQENKDRARVFRQSLTPEALETLRQEALARMDPAHQDLVARKAPGSEIMLKLAMDKICLERMKLT